MVYQLFIKYIVYLIHLAFMVKVVIIKKLIQLILYFAINPAIIVIIK